MFLAGREATNHTIESGKGGLIVNMSSMYRAGNIGQTNYVASKADVVAFITTWAKSLAALAYSKIHYLKRLFYRLHSRNYSYRTAIRIVSPRY